MNELIIVLTCLLVLTGKTIETLEAECVEEECAHLEAESEE